MPRPGLPNKHLKFFLIDMNYLKMHFVQFKL